MGSEGKRNGLMMGKESKKWMERLCRLLIIMQVMNVDGNLAYLRCVVKDELGKKFAVRSV